MMCFQTGTGEFGAELGHPRGASQVRRQQAGATSKHENLTLHELVVSLFFSGVSGELRAERHAQFDRRF